MRTQRAAILLMIITVVLLVPDAAVACGCNPFETTVLDAYKRSHMVVIARVLSVDKVVDAKVPFGSDISGATLIAEKVYKGDVKVNDQLKFAQGDGVLCSWSFDEKAVGERYLLYLFRPEKPSNPWYISTCNRSKDAEYAKEDLLYLDNLEKHRGQTRISGVVNSEGGLKIDGRKIRIIGRNKTYVTTTDDDGVYEIYGLPSGRYIIEPELPFGWKVDEFHLTRQYTRADMYRRPSNRVAFTLQRRKHFGVDMDLG
jgi:hypothetical protein